MADPHCSTCTCGSEVNVELSARMWADELSTEQVAIRLRQLSNSRHLAPAYRRALMRRASDIINQGEQP